MQHPEKFKNPFETAKGEKRASVVLKKLETLWINTGTQCNLSCKNCYIESDPKNDRLVFFTNKDLVPYLDEISTANLPTKEVGFTGGEPFLNPNIIEMLKESLERGFKTIVLTNAHRLMNRYKSELLNLSKKYGDLFLVRVSLDHYTQKTHEEERGEGTFESTLRSMKWLCDNNILLAVAGRSLLDEEADVAQKGYEKLFIEKEIKLDFKNPQTFVVFPEMDTEKDVPEITTDCWGILNKSPDSMMCSTSRMIVKRKGEENSKVQACTLLAYDKQFELGETLKESKKIVQLNHPFCAQFCVLGGSSCS